MFLMISLVPSGLPVFLQLSAAIFRIRKPTEIQNNV